MRGLGLFLIAGLLWGAAGPTQAQIPMTPEDLYRLKKVADPRVSPDGEWVAYTLHTPDIDANDYQSDIWLVPLQGGTPKQLTTDRADDHSPRWSPKGTQLAFISARDSVDNIFIIDIKAGEARQLTHAETNLSDPRWSRNGRFLVCHSRVLPDGDLREENWTVSELPDCSARTIDHLLFRQWNQWLGDKRNHVLLVNAATGQLRDVTPADFDTPPVSLSSGHDYDIDPQGTEICYVRLNSDMPAASTNHDIYVTPSDEFKPKLLTDNPAYDSNPHYSPDGRYIAYTAMEKPGYESDREVLILYDRRKKTHVALTESLDRSVAQVLWAPDSKSLFFNARDEGKCAIYQVDLAGKLVPLIRKAYNTRLSISPDGAHLVFLRSTNTQPNEIFRLSLPDKTIAQLTHTNDTVLASLDLAALEEFWFNGAEGTPVHGFLQRPPDFNPQKKYPVVLTIHGGPQGMWADRFMLTWFTFPLVSAPGYVGVFINPRGSTGYGSQFREQVSEDYGGRCYQDLMLGLDYVLDQYAFTDEDRLAAIGGSFGGYSVNWIMGQTDRFDCIVSHASLYDLQSFWGATEELWFPEWDFGGTPWEAAELYEKWSPSSYAHKFATPTLVTQGELDFRVPYTQSLQLFTALQRQQIPSELVFFSDEGHVISSPQNNIRWWREIHRWLAAYLE